MAPPAKAPPVTMPTQNGSHVDLIVFDSVLELSAIATETLSIYLKRKQNDRRSTGPSQLKFPTS